MISSKFAADASVKKLDVACQHLSSVHKHKSNQSIAKTRLFKYIENFTSKNIIFR